MKQLKQPQVLAGAMLLVLVLVGGGVFALTRQNKPAEEQTQQTTQKKKVSEPVNQIAVAERPYVQILPQADGRNLELQVNTTPKPAESAEYELEYQAGTLLQGAFGLVELESLPSKVKILLGSCSAGGACTYHTDVKGGSLVLKFSGPENYALKQDWRYFDNWGNKETQFASKDAKFQLDSKELAKQRFIVVYNSPGYPEGVTGTVVSEPYSLTGSSAMTGKAEVTMRANEEGNLTIMGYDGSAWNSFETTVDGKTATATVDLMELYVVVKS
jgi:hypothetical protein